MESKQSGKFDDTLLFKDIYIVVRKILKMGISSGRNARVWRKSELKHFFTHFINLNAHFLIYAWKGTEI